MGELALIRLNPRLTGTTNGLQSGDLITVTVEGDKLVVQVRTGAVTKTQEVPKPRVSLADALAADLLLRPGAKIGDKVVTAEYVSMLMKEVESTFVLKERKRYLKIMEIRWNT